VDLLEINHYSDGVELAKNVERFMEEIAPTYPGKVRLNRRKLSITMNNRGGSSPNGNKLVKPLKAFCR